MKSTLYLFSAILILSAVSCKDEKKEKVAYVKDSTVTATGDVTAPAPSSSYKVGDGKSVTVTAEKVPAPVVTSFTKKYPKILAPQWIYYTPVESDELPMDDTYYYVQFEDKGDDYITWWNDEGEWVKTSTIIPLGDPRLPEAVNKTITSQYPGYTIESISLDNDKNMDMYKIKLNKGEEKVKVKILPSGEIMKLKTS